MALISGLVGGILYQVFVWIFFIIGIAKVTPFQLGAYVLIRPGIDITSLAAQLLGMVQHFANSSLLALIGIYFIRLLGHDYILLKGLAFGAIIYYIMYGGIAKLVIPVDILQPNLSTSVASALTAKYYLTSIKKKF